MIRLTHAVLLSAANANLSRPTPSAFASTVFCSVMCDFSSSTSENLVFMTNQGGNTGCSGEWTICGGSSQSYADETVSTGLIIYAHQRWCGSLYMDVFHVSSVHHRDTKESLLTNAIPLIRKSQQYG